MFWGLQSPTANSTPAGLQTQIPEGGASAQLCSSRGGIALAFDRDFEPIPAGFPLTMLEYGASCLSDTILGLEDLPGDPWEVPQELELAPNNGLDFVDRRDTIATELQKSNVQGKIETYGEHPGAFEGLLTDTSSRNAAVGVCAVPYSHQELDNLSQSESEVSVTDISLLRHPERLSLSDLEETDGSDGAVRPRNGSRRQLRNQPGKKAIVECITIEFLEDNGILDIPLQEACRALGLTHSVFKRRLHELGIRKWPSRKRNSLRALLKTTEHIEGPICGLDGNLATLRGVLQAEINTIQGNTRNWSAIKRFRQTIFKHRCLQKKAKLECLPPQTPPPRRPIRLRDTAIAVMSQAYAKMGAMDPNKHLRGSYAEAAAEDGAEAFVNVTWGAHKSRLPKRRARSASA